MEQLQHQAWAELCWYFPESREQFRIAGRLTVVGEDYPDADLRKVPPVSPIPGAGMQVYESLANCIPSNLLPARSFGRSSCINAGHKSAVLGLPHHSH